MLSSVLIIFCQLSLQNHSFLVLETCQNQVFQHHQALISVLSSLDSLSSPTSLFIMAQDTPLALRTWKESPDPKVDIKFVRDLIGDTNAWRNVEATAHGLPQTVKGEFYRNLKAQKDMSVVKFNKSWTFFFRVSQALDRGAC